ncbi:MAG: hypothetical protein Q8L47_01335 [bacterium]|nr:hypothetical protein [bacterium]
MALPRKGDVVWATNFNVLGIVDNYNKKRETLLMQSCFYKPHGKFLYYDELLDPVKAEDIKIPTTKEVFEMLAELISN